MRVTRKILTEGSPVEHILVHRKGRWLPVMRYNTQTNELTRQASDYFGKYRGYGIYKDVIDYCIGKFGLATPLTIIGKSGKVHKTSLKDWKEKAEIVHYKGYGKQYVLPLEDSERTVRLEINMESERLSTIQERARRRKAQLIESNPLFAGILK